MLANMISLTFMDHSAMPISSRNCSNWQKITKIHVKLISRKKTDIFSLYINKISRFRKFVKLISRKILEILEFCKFAMQNPEIKQYCCHQCHFFEIFSFLLFELLKKLLWIRFQVIFQESSSPPTGQSRAVVISNMTDHIFTFWKN